MSLVSISLAFELHPFPLYNMQIFNIGLYTGWYIWNRLMNNTKSQHPEAKRWILGLNLSKIFFLRVLSFYSWIIHALADYICEITFILQ